MSKGSRNRPSTMFSGAWIVLGWASLGLVIGCGADNGGGGGGQGGASAVDETHDLGELPSDVIHDSRWDPPSGMTSLVAPTVQAITCTLPSQCASGFCVDGFCCDNGCANKCMACSAAKKGGGLDGICGSVAANTDPDNDCPAGECDGKNVCKNYNGMACNSSAECLSKYCVDGFCCGNICMGACQACSAAKKGGGVDGACGSIKAGTDPDNECSGSCNGSGACDSSPQPTYPNGTACTGASQCQSGFCADGVCCDSWCLGTCQACSAAKKKQGVDGVCGNIAYDQDPDEECWGGGCNGQGVCKQYNGVPCGDKAQCLSNYCVDGFCCGNICTSLCYACSEAKKGQGFDGVCGPIAAGKDVEGECNPGECNGSGACNQPQTPLTNGTTCISGGQCASGNCVDGVCCDTACTGTCLACTTAKKGSGANGTCGPIAAETNPDAECNGGRCDGTGACRYYNGAPCAAKTDCFSNYCVDGLCCGNACLSTCYACSQAKKGGGADGVCAVIGAARDPDNECNPGECNGAGACNQPQMASLANGAACSVGTQCISGNCVDGVCCDTTCTETCKACSAAKKGSGADGVCGLIGSTKNPDNECVSGYCNGAGACIYFNGVACSATSQCISNYCVDGNCCGNACTGSCMACTIAKRGGGINGQCGPIANGTDPDNECALTCNGSGACNKAPNGSTCTAASDCTSGFCVDGVCCNTACAGSCEACNTPGANGTCSFGCGMTCSGTLGFPNAPLSAATIALLGKNVAIDAADFDNNGNQDIVVVSSSGAVNVLMGQGTLTLGASSTIGSTTSPIAVATGQLNADGFADIVVANGGNGGVSVFLNQGNGTFAPKVDYATGVVGALNYDESDGLRVADVNGDGKLDIATTNKSDGTISLLLGQGNGTFPNKVDIQAPVEPVSLAIADLNGDAIVDMAVTTKNSAAYEFRVSVLLGLGGGAFGAATLYHVVDHAFTSLTTGDINGDGRLDLVTNKYSDRLYVLLNQGNGTFANAVGYDSLGTARLITANVNGDAFADVVAATNGRDSIVVSLGQANGTLMAGREYVTDNHAYSLVAVDLDKDGDKDVVTANLDSLSVRSNSGTGTFGTVVNADPKISAPGWGIVSRDFNNDGILDLASVLPNFSTDSTITVSLGQTGGTFTAGTPQSFAQAFSSVDGYALEDLNGDGRPDLLYCDSLAQACYTRFYQGNGTFGAATTIDIHDFISNSFGMRGPMVGDVDGNGTRDLVVSRCFTGSDVSWPLRAYVATLVWLNPGNGVFNSPITQYHYNQGVPTGADNGCPTVAGDFNGDGKLDLALSSARLTGTRILLSSGNGNFTFGGLLPESNYQHVADLSGDGTPDLLGRALMDGLTYAWFNIGGGMFATAGMIPDVPTDVAIGDLNGDFKNDLVFATGGNRFGVKLNQGNAVFGPRQEYLAGAGPTGVAMGDWNADGRLDLAVQNYSSASVTLHFNTCLP